MAATAATVLPPPDAAVERPPPAAVPARLMLAPPPPDLAPLVEYLWQLELPGGAPPDAFWRVVVDGYVDVAVRLPLDPALVGAAARASGTGAGWRDVADALATSPTVVCGAATTSRALPLSGPVLVTGMRFRLGHAGRVLRSSATELVDGARPLRDVLAGGDAATAARAMGPDAAADAGAVARAAVQALAGALPPAGDAGRATARAAAPARADAPPDGVEPGDVLHGEALRAFAREGAIALARRLVARGRTRSGDESAVARVRGALALLDRAGDPHARVDDDLEGQGAARVAAVARTLAVSQRTLERLFAEHVGFAPRTYQRLRRVGAVAEALEQEAWAHEAHGREAQLREAPVREAPARDAPVRDAPVRDAPVRATAGGGLPLVGGADAARAAGGAAPAAPRPRARSAPRTATLSELAHRVGYTDHAHMTREFTRVMGTAPSTYRRDAHAAPLVRRFGPVDFERTVPWGTIGRGAATLPRADAAADVRAGAAP